MLHTKIIGRIALALSIFLFSGVSLVANAAPQAWYKTAANLPFISLPDTRSSSPSILGHAEDSVQICYGTASQVLVVNIKQNFNLNTVPSGAQLT